MTQQRTSTDDVFINCPFDHQFNAIFNALIFTIYACGFRPRSARELDDGGQARLDKLYAIIEQCRYGILDLSRTELDNVFLLPRFNMPVELGIFLGAKRYGGKLQKDKRLIIFDIEQYRYQRFISDLAGMDIHAHSNDPSLAINEARNWLANVSRRKLPSGRNLIRAYHRFNHDLPALAQALDFDVDALPYVDFERFVVTWLLEAKADGEN
ncbi:hypothetical protein [Blastomonas sp.]|uniref:hypothetical protein n=1 Tax=Blastomonas sp. TaxID=1909299 RepID=UPI003592F119